VRDERHLKAFPALNTRISVDEDGDILIVVHYRISLIRGTELAQLALRNFANRTFTLRSNLIHDSGHYKRPRQIGPARWVDISKLIAG
jgi:hypothetical protein